jgi:hypothetical protein
MPAVDELISRTRKALVTPSRCVSSPNEQRTLTRDPSGIGVRQVSVRRGEQTTSTCPSLTSGDMMEEHNGHTRRPVARPASATHSSSRPQGRAVTGKRTGRYEWVRSEPIKPPECRCTALERENGHHWQCRQFGPLRGFYRPAPPTDGHVTARAVKPHIPSGRG